MASQISWAKAKEGEKAACDKKKADEGEFERLFKEKEEADIRFLEADAKAAAESQAAADAKKAKEAKDATASSKARVKALEYMNHR